MGKVGKAGLHTVIILYGISMVFLFYRQAGWTGGAVYESDLPAHIRMIVEDGWYYSLTAFIYQAFLSDPVYAAGQSAFGNLRSRFSGVVRRALRISDSGFAEGYAEPAGVP